MTVDQIRRWISGTIRPGKVETDSVETEESVISPPSSTPFDYKEFNRLLHDGYVVNSLGNVYGPGGSAVQDALDDLENNNTGTSPAGLTVGGFGKVWVGKGKYDEVSTGVTMTVIEGLGQVSQIGGETSSHAFEWKGEDIWRLRLKDLRMFTKAGNGDPYDAIRFENVGINDYGMGEYFLTNIYVDQADRHAFRAVGASNAAIGRGKMNGVHFDDTDDNVVSCNQYVNKIVATGEFFTTQASDLRALHLDGKDNAFFGIFRNQGSNSTIEFGPNSERNFVAGNGVVPIGSEGPIDNGTENIWHGERTMEPFSGQLQAKTYGPLSTDNGQKKFIGQGPHSGIGGQRATGGTIVDGGSTDHAITISDGFFSVVGDLKAKTTAGQGNNFDAVHITKDDANSVRGVVVTESDRHGIMVESTAAKCYLIGNTFASTSIDGDDIHIDGNDCVAINSHRGGSVTIDGDNNFVIALGASITDNGTGNTTHS